MVDAKQIFLQFEFLFHLMNFIAKSQTFSGTLAVHICNARNERE